MLGELFSVLVVLGHISSAISGAEKLKEVVIDGQPIINFSKTPPKPKAVHHLKRKTPPTSHGSPNQ